MENSLASLTIDPAMTGASHTTAADPMPEEAPRTFPRFPDLPPELRDQIWEAAVLHAYEPYHTMTEESPRLFCVDTGSVPGRFHTSIDIRMRFKTVEETLIAGLMALLLASKESNEQSRRTILGGQEEDQELPLLALWGSSYRGIPIRQLIMPRNDIICLHHCCTPYQVETSRFTDLTLRSLHHILLWMGQLTTLRPRSVGMMLQRTPHLKTLYVDVNPARLNPFPDFGSTMSPCRLHHVDLKGNTTRVCDLPPYPPSEYGEESVDNHDDVADGEVVDGVDSSKGAAHEGEDSAIYNRVLGLLLPDKLRNFHAVWKLCTEAGVKIRFIKRSGWRERSLPGGSDTTPHPA
ncbi:hypothetical protein PG994_003840 [Apiospora phragmitis]|uniref:2EXR domain-containing protein n=1 Tax=Apiospora phragmitis TaxID=2905665 RepID=A0ABR1VZD0_9PEZI